jgi:hypothetical protein
MSLQAITSEENYSAIVETLLRSEGVSQADVFGSAGQMRVNNRIFAMLVNGNLVVKLPAERREALVAAGDGAHFDPGHGRPMTGWVELHPESKEDWMAVSHEAMTFVGGAYQPILG